jgi:hypothetical protein
VWGSDINPVSGKKNKRCKDSKRIAVMLVGDPDAQIFAWRLSPMNMLAFADAVKDAVRQNIDLERVVFDASFDAKSDYPRVIFTIKRPLTEEELHAAAQLRQSEGAKAAVGMGAPMVAAPVREVVMEAPAVEEVPVAAPEKKVTPLSKAKPGAAEKVDLDALLGD